MGRTRTGHVTRRRGKFEAWLGDRYLGIWPTEEKARRIIAAELETEDGKERDTLSAFGAGWIEKREIDARERGKARAGLIERSRWDTHIATAPFYERRLSAITPLVVQTWIGELRKTQATGVIRSRELQKVKRDRKLSRNTIANTVQLLKLCFDSALLAGLVKANPCAVVKIGRAAVKRDEGELVEHLTVREIDAVLGLELPERERAFFALGIFGGLRLGELLGLRWGDVDGKRIMVRRAYAAAVKSNASRRDVPALPPVVEAVRAYRASLPAAPIGGLMFPTESGSVHGPSYTMAWSDKLYRKGGELRTRVGWATKAGIVGKTFHVLRHTCGCHLLMGTWEEWTGPLELKHVSAWLGHTSEEVTRRHYAQFARDSLTNRVQDVLRAQKRREKESEGT